MSGARWGKGAIVVHFQMRSFLVLRSTSPPIKQAGNPAFLPFLALEGHTIAAAPRRAAALMRSLHTATHSARDTRDINRPKSRQKYVHTRPVPPSNNLIALASLS